MQSQGTGGRGARWYGTGSAIKGLTGEDYPRYTRKPKGIDYGYTLGHHVR